MSDTFPDETLYPVLTSLADEDRIFASNSAAGHESSQLKGSTIKGLIDALKGTPPETLDTLAKLAAAINNDPAFHTTLATALAGKAPLASPALTGTPTAPTASAGTETTQLATTAFVSSYVSKWTYSFHGAGGSITGEQWKIHGFGATGTLTVPLASSVPNGAQIACMVVAGGAAVTVTRSGSDQFVTPTGLETTYTLRGNGSSIVLVRVTASAWACVGAPDSLINAAIAPLAPLASPALTGTPTAPTAAPGTNTTQIATTAFCAAGFLPRFESVVERTAATTAEPNKLYVNVKDDSAENTLMLTLPSPTGNAGKVIGLSSRYRRSSYTNEEANWRLTGHIDGIASNTYWQGYWELGSALLWCDGTTWHMLTDWRAEQEW
jgi:hypothetical protein